MRRSLLASASPAVIGRSPPTMRQRLAAELKALKARDVVDVLRAIELERESPDELAKRTQITIPGELQLHLDELAAAELRRALR